MKYTFQGRYSIKGGHEPIKLKRENWPSKAMSRVRELFTGKNHSASYQYYLNMALIEAANFQDIDYITHLIDSGADAHLKRSASLYIEVCKSSQKDEIMELLISRGADIHEDDEWALKFASTLEHEEVVNTMLEYGSDIHASNDFAIKAASAQNYLPTINLLLIDFNMPIKAETKQWLEDNNCTEALEFLAKRDLNNRLDSALKPKDETTAKPKKLKI